MPKLNHTGPEGLGSRTGRKLGLCGKAALPDAEQSGEMGKGMGMRRHTGDGNLPGKGKRLRYFQEKNYDYKNENCCSGHQFRND